MFLGVDLWHVMDLFLIILVTTGLWFYLLSILMQKSTYDPSTSYYTPVFRPSSNGDSHFSQFLGFTAASKYNGNVTVLSGESVPSSQKATVSNLGLLVLLYDIWVIVRVTCSGFERRMPNLWIHFPWSLDYGKCRGLCDTLFHLNQITDF